ncbi:right-handed parallel beta-helix repeat-containing protein [Desulfobacter postgatei]|uniref:Uncharacterized protein n=1 Tax=Desulfobacter postgatei 2ac9 TaxID=879212 RepID=I5B255_9BACT|nr:right-handed parallel beta-helix repeat-containing protein [Desulfobacter postgatei]EIM63568.1 hypothetical protein DespoDRAFT_01644 [Desulfobacter postgatei 2ac9]
MKRFILIILISVFMGTGSAFAALSQGIIESKEDLARLEPGHWYKVKDSGDTFSYTNWPGDFPCNSPYNSRITEITDYSGAVVSQQDRAILLHGGGHVATGFNGILAFDLDTLKWKCVDSGTIGGVMDEWESGKPISPSTRLAANINDVLYEFKVTSVWDSHWSAKTGPNEPDWATAPNIGDTVIEDHQAWGEWTNMGIIGWQPNHDYIRGKRILGDVKTKTPSRSLWGDGKSSLDFFKCISDKGSSGSTEPDWAKAEKFGETVIDGDLIWKNMGMSHYQNNYALQEHGGYPWEDKKGSVHSYSHLVFSETMNAMICPISFTWHPSATGFINDHPWIFDIETSMWTEWEIDSRLNELGVVNISTMAIDGKRDIVWMYRRGGKSGPRLWSLDLNTKTWTARDADGTPHAGNGGFLVINPKRDELILYGSSSKSDEKYCIWEINPDNFNSQGHAPVKKLYIKGQTGTAPTGDWDFITSTGYQEHYGVYDTTQDVIVQYAGAKEGSKDRNEAVYLYFSENHHWVKVPAHPNNKITPANIYPYFYGRWNYIEFYNVYIFVDKIDRDVYIYKLSHDKKDTNAPIVDFDIPLTSFSKQIPITKFKVQDDHQWTVKFAVTESVSAPALDSDQWTYKKPETYTTKSGSGPLTLYAHAMDMFGNISAPVSRTVTLNVDDIPPEISNFKIPAASASLQVDVTNFSAADNTEVTGYLITESADIPSADDPGWVSSPPDKWQLSGGGDITLYGWTKDADFNISRAATAPVQVVLSEHQSGAIRVGPHRIYKTLEEAINHVNRSGLKGQCIEIDAGTAYEETSALPYIAVDDLAIVGVSGGLGLRAHIYPANGIGGRNAFLSNTTNGSSAGLTLKWLEISDVYGTSKNSPAVRMHNTDVATSLLIEDCKIYDSYNGLLVGHCPNLDVTLRRTEIYGGGTGGGQEHNIYVGTVNKFLMEYCYTHDSKGGQLIKTRGKYNRIQYNRITDEGVLHNSNYPIDIPSGGESYVIGNLVQKAEGATVDTFVNYGREAKMRVYYQDPTTTPPGSTHYEIYRNGQPTGETFYGQYRYGSYLYSWSSVANTEAGAVDVREGDELVWNGGADRLTVGPRSGWDWNTGPHARHLYVAGNTFVNEKGGATYFIRAHIDTEHIMVINNLIVDRAGGLKWDAAGARPDTEFNITDKQSNIWTTQDPGLKDIDDFDYSLKVGAHTLIDAGDYWGVSASGQSLAPRHSYKHPLSCILRNDDGKPDIGAYAYQESEAEAVCGETEPDCEQVILSDSVPDITVNPGSPVCIYGTSGINNITVHSGAAAELIHFPGNNSIIFSSSAAQFSVSRSGTMVLFEGWDNTRVKVPASLSTQIIVFNDTALPLSIDHNQVLLGRQQVLLSKRSIQTIAS